jgi:Calx-beta domain
MKTGPIKQIESTAMHPVSRLQRSCFRTLALVLVTLALAHAPVGAQVLPDESSDIGNADSANPPRDSSNPPSDDPRSPELGSLSDLALQLDYTQLEIAENRAYIPLFFTIKTPNSGSFFSTNDITVRASFVGGTATPGKDFDFSLPVRVVPAQGGLNSMSWVQLPLIQDEENEGAETAIFDLSIDGSTNAPVRMEVSILDDLTTGEVGFISPRFQINEGSTNGYVQLRMWRTLNSRNAATVTYRLEGSAAALAILGGQTNRSAIFQPGDSQIFIRIPLVDDTDPQGTQDITLTIESSDDGMKIMGDGRTVLTVADDETLPPPAELSIRGNTNDTGERGVQLSTQVPRGYQVRLEYSDNGAAGPWQLYWILEGADTERYAFNNFDASVMRMFRILPPEPLDYTFPW